MRMTHMKPLSLSLLALTLAGLAACSNKDAPAPAATPAAAPQAGADSKAPAAAAAETPAPAAVDSSASDKLGLYIECFNRLDNSAHNSISRYSSWVKDMKAGPTGKETVVYGLYKIDPDATQSCKKDFAKAAGQSPAMAKLDAEGQTYIQALDALSTVVLEADTYYDRGNYKDDGFAKGKQLHPQLVERMDAFEAASEKFSDELDVQNDQVLEARMQQLEKEQGRTLPYLQMATMSRAKQLVGLIQGETFDVAKASERMDAYEKSADELLAYVSAHKDAAPGMWGRYNSTLEDFRKAAKGRIRRIRDHVAYTEGEKMMLEPASSWMVEGSGGQVTKAYNSLVEAGNALN
ncbi:YiiG family protein [Dyella silvatica]|uniref:YiiG family protein n=1 Tax=Dyella silvatica TaxID=2992128 RepID=UPI00225A377D|nr:YiiG family protein [Dyella silvatica]